MVLIGIGVLCFLFAYWVVKTEKMTAFETLATGLFVSFLCIEYGSLLLNLKRLDFPKNAPLMTTSHVISQTMLFPIIGVFILNFSFKRKGWGNRLTLVVAGGMLMTLLEYTGEWSGMLKHQKWSPLYSFFIWSAVLALAAAFLKCMRNLISKELKIP